MHENLKNVENKEETVDKGILTAALDVACIGCLGSAVGAPPAAVDLEDAIVSGSICVVVDGVGVET